MDMMIKSILLIVGGYMLLLIGITLTIFESSVMANGTTVQDVKELQTRIVL